MQSFKLSVHGPVSKETLLEPVVNQTPLLQHLIELFLTSCQELLLDVPQQHLYIVV